LSRRVTSRSMALLLSLSNRSRRVCNHHEKQTIKQNHASSSVSQPLAPLHVQRRPLGARDHPAILFA
jgi:hypothetical protein